MIRSAFTLILIMISRCVGAATGLEAWRDLDVRMESLPEPMHVNGLSVVLQRATGVVWRSCDALGSAVDSGRRCPWCGLTPWVMGHSVADSRTEVLQWRGVGANAELLGRAAILERNQDDTSSSLSVTGRMRSW
jgi:hypothetical protein